jgi:hypothetical protein
MVMTHPTLGYTNFRFDGDDAVHMAAFNGAGHVIACKAEGPGEHDLWPHGVDAPVDCPDCLRAQEADWLMAATEQLRREGAEATWPEPTLDEVYDVAERLVSEVDARVEAAVLWGDGDDITVSFSDDYHFAEDKRVIKARQGDDKVYRTVDGVSQRSPEELNEAVTATVVDLSRQQAESGTFLGEVIDRHDRDAQLARYLARSPLAYLASEAGKSGAPPKVIIGPASMLPSDVPLADPGADRVRRAIEAAQAEWALGYPDREPPPEVPGIDEMEFTHGGEVVIDDGESDYPDTYVPPVHIAALMEPANWCHVHNRVAEPNREECSECEDERGEDRKAGES